ncbi:sigma-70 family RNA polymerase sigma factor [Amycolatopsis sp. OK19-0408]|uniref:RNA polymerase sigma factor n=1 Tax=Amycolatopsis iheyensis TaxID=2945988 RepID=A0A9X2SM65_9PSEU|nr:sigma-70 family RNA polymerase sigma factor [Amycolatopsis iheyensis]MCR6487477.1 sigma-70 family RNA polymerase sigma factor [Amycolatopsis iheyensis]
MARILGGDPAAYGTLVDRYTALAHRTAYLLGAGHEAEDVVQEAFVKAFRALSSFRGGASFRAWLLRIVANETHNLVRSRRRRAATELRAARQEPTHADGPESRAFPDTALLDAVRTLPEKNRAVVICRYFLDLTEGETAEVLGCPRGSVKSRGHRAFARLRELLAEPDKEVVGD